jgi:hypothetical protein
MCVNMYIYIYICIFIYVCIYIHTHTHHIWWVSSKPDHIISVPRNLSDHTPLTTTRTPVGCGGRNGGNPTCETITVGTVSPWPATEVDNWAYHRWGQSILKTPKKQGVEHERDPPGRYGRQRRSPRDARPRGKMVSTPTRLYSTVLRSKVE